MQSTIQNDDSEKETFPDVIETPVSWGDINLQRADDFKAIVNPETGKVFSVVSQDYKLIRHEEAIERVNAVVNENPELGEYVVSTEFYNDGGRMRTTYCFHKIEVNIDKGDPVNPELHLLNSYDISWPFTLILGAFRMICSNGLVIGKKFLHIRKRHIYEIDELDLEEQISTALKRFRRQANQWKRWADRPLKASEYQKIMKVMKFGKNATEDIEYRVRRDASGFVDGYPIMSLWIFFNIVTWYITHYTASLRHRVELERRLRTALRGV